MYSEKAAEISAKKHGRSKMAVGFRGLVNIDEGAYSISSTEACLRGDLDKAERILNDRIHAMIGRFRHQRSTTIGYWTGTTKFRL